MYLDLYRLFILLVFAVFPIGGCAGNTSPIQTLPEESRQVMEESDGDPIAIRLTQPATVAGISLPAGSIMRQISDTQCNVFPADTIAVGTVHIPAASEFEMVWSGERYIWNGIVKIGGAMQFNQLNLSPGDGIFFTGDLVNAPVLTQIRMGSHREFVDQWYPAETVVNVDATGAVSGISPSLPPEALVAQQDSYWKQKEQHDARCMEICGNHKKRSDAHKSCMTYCLSR